jgi:hypothetical protein
LDLDDFISRSGLTGGQRFVPGVPLSLASATSSASPLSKRARRDRSDSVVRSRPKLVRRALRKKLEDFKGFRKDDDDNDDADKSLPESFERLAARAEQRQADGSGSESGGSYDYGGPSHSTVVPPLGISDPLAEKTWPGLDVDGGEPHGPTMQDLEVLRALREERAVRVDEQIRLADLQKKLFLDAHNETASRVVETARSKSTLKPGAEDSMFPDSSGRQPSSLIVKKARKGLRSQREATAGVGAEDINVTLRPLSLL